ncbi:MAG: hypothetical protein V9E93_20130 [Steroidobacteraceae bacterium]
MLPAIGLIVLAYLVSLSQADRTLMSLHVIYIFQFFSCLVVFLLAYNYSRLVESERSIVNLLFLINVLVIVYCLLQLSGWALEKASCRLASMRSPLTRTDMRVTRD